LPTLVRRAHLTMSTRFIGDLSNMSWGTITTFVQVIRAQKLKVALGTAFMASVVGVPTASALDNPYWLEARVTDRNFVRLLASVQGSAWGQEKAPIRWCLAIDGQPVTTNYAVSTSGANDTKAGSFDQETGCWSRAEGMLVASAEIHAAKLKPGDHTFAYLATFSDGRKEQISTSLTVPRIVPSVYWASAVPSGVASGLLAMSAGSDSPTASWCLYIDGKPISYDASRYSSVDANAQIYRSPFSPTTGCWTSSNIYFGSFEIATQVLKNGSHSIRLVISSSNGESSELDRSIIVRNRTTADLSGIWAPEVKYGSRTTSIDVNAQFGNADSYSLRIGTSRSNMTVRKKGTVRGFGRVTSRIGGLLPSTTYYVQATAAGVNGKAFSKVVRIRTETPVRPVVSSVPAQVPSPGGTIGAPSLVTPTVPAAFVEVCEVRVSTLSSSFHGQGYDWAIYRVWTTGAKTRIRGGIGYPGGTWQDQLPAGCPLP